VLSEELTPRAEKYQELYNRAQRATVSVLTEQLQQSMACELLKWLTGMGVFLVHGDSQRGPRMRHLIAPAILSILALAPIPTAQALPVTFIANLDGPSENPPNASPGTGTALVTIDRVAHTMFIDVEFDDLLGTTTAAHIHCCVAPPGIAGVATTTPTFPGFPLGMTSGTYQQLFDMTQASSYNPAFLNNAINLGSTATAEATLFDGIESGQAYFNIHTDLFPGGEIRGFLVPEAGTLGLLLLGMGALLGYRRAKPQ
jgi:hypothetical protein